MVVSDEFKTLFINMVSYEPNNRMNIQEVLNSSWLRETIKLFNEDSKELEEIEYKINNKFKEIGKEVEFEISKKIEEEEYATRSSPNYEKNKAFFSEKPLPKNPDIDFNNCIKIKGDINQDDLIDLMNVLFEQFIKQNEIYITTVKDKLEFIVGDENDGEEEEEEEQEQEEYNEKVTKY